MLFRAGLYRRNALQVHADLHPTVPLSSHYFTRWLARGRPRSPAPSGEKVELAKTPAAHSMSRRLLGESGSKFATTPRHPTPPYHRKECRGPLN
ncbi:MAG: hypothetical protein ACXV3F_15815 [Frankiaceae bacterium]